MPKDAVGFEVRGVKELDRALRKLGGPTARKMSRKAVKEGAKVIVRHARSGAPVWPIDGGGTLKKSLGSRLWTARDSGTIYAAIGPRKGFRTAIGATRDGRVIFKNPVNYAHIVELGTKRGIKPTHFMEKAIRAARFGVLRKVIRRLRLELKAA